MREEIELLNRARALEQDALAEIHDAYYDAIYRYISFRVNNRQMAEDLTSEVFTRFLSALRDRSAPQNTIRGWLYGAASLVLKEYYRRKKRDDFSELDERLPGGAVDPEENVEMVLQNRQLQEAVTQLTEDQQQVLALRFGYEMPIKEVAELIDKSEGSVKMLQARAIAALARILSGPEVSHE